MDFPRRKLSFVKPIALSTADQYAPTARDSRSIETRSGRPALIMRRRTVGGEVRYSATPEAHAMDGTHKQVDTRTYDHPTDLRTQI